MALLVALSQKPGELWQRNELLGAIWANGSGSDEGLSRLVSLLRKTLASDHGLENTVKTIPKLGYRLDASVELPDPEGTAKQAAASPAIEAIGPGNAVAAQSRLSRIHVFIVAALVLAGIAFIWFPQDNRNSVNAASQIANNQARISLAVLPIELMKGVEDRPFLAEGMTRDLTAALSQVSNAWVAPYSSTRLLSGNMVDAVAAAEDLDVQYVITGAMGVQGDLLILRIDLADMIDNRQIWSKRFARPLDSFYELEDEIVREISTSIFSEIQASEIASVSSRDEFDLSVYELLQKAESERYAYGREPAMRIVSYLRRALAIDPDNYSSRAAMAIQLAQNVISGFSDDPARDAPLALRYLDEMRAIAPNDPKVLTSSAMVQYYINGDMQQARGLLEQSLAIDPNEPHAAVVLGLIRCYSGQADAGLTLIRNAEVRAPRDPRYGIWAWFRGACQSVQGDLESAERAADEAILRNPNYPAFYFASASFKCLLGKNKQAQDTVRLAARLDSAFGQQDYERLLSTAGFPGTPGKSRNEVFRQMRTCLASDIE